MPSKCVEWGAAALLAITATGCSIESPTIPAVSGPSELAISLTVSVTPEVLPRDGMSEAVVNILARDPYARPLPNLDLRADIVVDGLVSEFGRLSDRRLVTDASGRTATVYRAPEQILGTAAPMVVSILLSPLGGDARGATWRSVDILLVQPTLDGP
jgi:hypothetical protein